MITETAGAETPASIMEPLSRWEAASLSAIERDCARSGSYNEVVGIDLPETRSRAGSTASTSTLYVSDDSEKGSGIDGFVVRRPVVILEAPRAPSLYGALERTLSLTRRLDRTLPELPLGLPVERARNEGPLDYSERLYRFTKNTPEYTGRSAALLAEKHSPFLREALVCYIRRFHFEKYPIDMAL